MLSTKKRMRRTSAKKVAPNAKSASLPVHRRGNRGVDFLPGDGEVADRGDHRLGGVGGNRADPADRLLHYAGDAVVTARAALVELGFEGCPLLCRGSLRFVASPLGDPVGIGA